MVCVLWCSEFQHSSHAFIKSMCRMHSVIFCDNNVSRGKQIRELTYMQFCACMDDTPRYHIQTWPENVKETLQERMQEALQNSIYRKSSLAFLRKDASC